MSFRKNKKSIKQEIIKKEKIEEILDEPKEKLIDTKE